MTKIAGTSWTLMQYGTFHGNEGSYLFTAVAKDTKSGSWAPPANQELWLHL